MATREQQDGRQLDAKKLAGRIAADHTAEVTYMHDTYMQDLLTKL